MNLYVCFRFAPTNLHADGIYRCQAGHTPSRTKVILEIARYLCTTYRQQEVNTADIQILGMSVIDDKLARLWIPTDNILTSGFTVNYPVNVMVGELYSRIK